jgi:hypothetical protein
VRLLASFQILSKINLPGPSPRPYVRVYDHPALCPIVLVALSRQVRIIKATSLPSIDKGKAIPHIPRNGEEGTDDALAKGLAEKLGLHGNRPEQLDNGIWQPGLGSCTDDIRGPPEDILQVVDLGMGGTVLVGIDSAGKAWIWYGAIPSQPNSGLPKEYSTTSAFC